MVEKREDNLVLFLATGCFVYLLYKLLGCLWWAWALWPQLRGQVSNGSCWAVEHSVAIEWFCSEGHALVMSDIPWMPQTISFVTGDNRKSRRKQGRWVAEEVRGLSSPRSVPIYTSRIPQNSLLCFYGVVFSGMNHVETRVPPAWHHPQVVGSHQPMEDLSPAGRLWKRGSHGTMRKDTQKPS